MFDMIEMLGHSGYDLRSSIILTYGLDLPLYDGLIRRALNRAGVWNQAIFCDLAVTSRTSRRRPLPCTLASNIPSRRSGSPAHSIRRCICARSSAWTASRRIGQYHGRRAHPQCGGFRPV